MIRLLIASIGGTAEPILLSIEQQRPEYVIFVVSAGSRRIVREEIEPHLAWRPKDHDLIMIPDEQDLLGTVNALLERIPPLLRQWQVSMSEVVTDFTGGTKAMSAALVLAMSTRGTRFSYVGGTQRDKGGLGVVHNGSGSVLHLQNPWDALAMDALPQLELLFNRCRFRSVAELAQQTLERTDNHGTFFRGLHLVAESYYLWDSFQYRSALQPLRQAIGQLRPYADGRKNVTVTSFVADVGASLEALEAIEYDTLLFKSSLSNKDQQNLEKASGYNLIRDLLANAIRRADAEYKYEDAVARLYSAIEKMAKVQLKVKYGINNSDVDLSLIPDTALREELGKECSEGKVQLPLSRSYELLARLGDILGTTYHERQKELRKILQVRNLSLLAHGFNPVGEEVYHNLLTIALEFLRADIEDLPHFPKLTFAGQPL